MDLKKDVKWRVFLPAFLIIVVVGGILVAQSRKKPLTPNGAVSEPTAVAGNDDPSAPSPQQDNVIRGNLPDPEANDVINDTAGGILSDVDKSTTGSDDTAGSDTDIDLSDLDLDLDL